VNPVGDKLVSGWNSGYGLIDRVGSIARNQVRGVGVAGWWMGLSWAARTGND
jgi:hypothetical protein